METTAAAHTPVMMNLSDWQGLQGMKHLSEEQKLKVTADEFEATLLRQYLNDAMKPMFKGIINEEGVANDIYRSYFTDAIAQNLSQGTGVGISNALQSQLSKAVKETS